MTKPIQEQDPVAVKLDGLCDLLEQILARMPTAAERLAEEERRAWIRFFVADSMARPDNTTRGNAEQADSMLDEYRKRFPRPEAP